MVEEGRNTIDDRGSSPGGGWDQGRRRGQGLDIKHDTTINHGGIVKTLTSSWSTAARTVPSWLRVDAYLPGVYAISITGQFDKEIEEELESRGCRWRCRPVGSDPNAGI